MSDDNVQQQEKAELFKKLKESNKGLPIPYHKLLEYESTLEKAKDKEGLNKKLRSISSDNFFKYKDFLGSGPEKISESPTKY